MSLIWLRTYLLIIAVGTMINSTHLQAQDLRLQVQQAHIDLHTGPAASFPVTNVLLPGEWLQIKQQQTQWIEVQTPRQQLGWMSVKDLVHTRTPEGWSGEPLAEHLTVSPWSGGVTLGDFGGASLLGGLLGYAWNAYLGSELVVQQSLGEFAQNTLYALQITHRSFPDKKTSPLFMLGTGKLQTRPQTSLIRSADRDDDFLKVAIGFNHDLTNNLSLRGEYQHLVILTSRDDNPQVEAWTLSILSRF